MNTALMLPSGNVIYPSEGMLPSEIIVEECAYHADDPDGITVKEVGRMYAQNLFNNSSENMPEYTQAQQSQGVKDHNSDVMMNFGEHRAATITASDPRTIKMLNPTMPAFHGDKGKMISKIAALADELPQTPSRQRNTKKVVKGAEIVGLGVEHIDMLLKNTSNGGLHYIFDCCKIDPDLGPPTDRATFLRWLCAKMPCFIRALELFDYYIREQNERAMIVIETPWIQR